MDRCPTQAEDKDGLADEDGCPEDDVDADGVADTSDKCPKVAEDKDNVADEDGCPEKDADADAILDGVDRCPTQAEDKDGLADEDGCPEEDFDADGIADVKDQCPRKPETVNDYQDLDGCPDTAVPMAEMTATHIEIHDRIYFESGSAEIQPRSFGILNQVVTILKDNPQVTKVRIDGHTDNVGDETFNYDLSQRRVDSVRKYMIEKGIDASRLEARGNSELKPIASNDTPAGRARNRRVQFTILEVDGKPLPEVKE